MTALRIKSPHYDRFFAANNPKTIELRSYHCNKAKGQIILLLKSGDKIDGKHVVRGYTRFIECRLIHVEDLHQYESEHQVIGARDWVAERYGGEKRWMYMWKFDRTVKFEQAVPCYPTAGSQSWVSLYFDPSVRHFIPSSDQCEEKSIALAPEHLSEKPAPTDLNARQIRDLYKDYFLNEYPSLAVVYDLIDAKSGSENEFFESLSYIVECLRRNYSVLPVWKKRITAKHSSKIWIDIKLRRVHNGYSYSKSVNGQRVFIHNWRDSCVQTTLATNASLQSVVHNEWSTSDKHKAGHVGFASKESTLCVLCKQSGYKCIDKGNPFLRCATCSNDWHLHCIHESLLAASFYPPTLALPNNKYCRQSIFRTHKNGNYIVPGSDKFICVICRCKKQKRKRSQNHCLSWTYLFAFKDFHYFQHQGDYIRLKTTELNDGYLNLSQWWNSNLIDVRFVCYDRWQALPISKEGYQESLEVIKRIQRFGKKYNYFSSRDLNFFAKSSQLFAPIACHPIFWKSRGAIGSIIGRHIVSAAEHFLIRHLIVRDVSKGHYYSTSGDLETVIPVTSGHDIDFHPQQWDITASGSRTKYYCGPGHYTHPIAGNGRHNTTGIARKRDKHIAAVLCELNAQNSCFPQHLKLVKEFIAARYKSVKDDWIPCNAMQTNCYSSSGLIENHWDSLDWFFENAVIVYKTYKNSGIHLQYQSRRSKSVNPWMYHPLFEGDICDLRRWSFCWYQHCKTQWMVADKQGSVSTIFRNIRSTAMMYPYPHENQQQTHFIINDEIIEFLEDYYETRLTSTKYKALCSELRRKQRSMNMN